LGYEFIGQKAVNFGTAKTFGVHVMDRARWLIAAIVLTAVNIAAVAINLSARVHADDYPHTDYDFIQHVQDIVEGCHADQDGNILCR
jgi:hypothetical protein